MKCGCISLLFFAFISGLAHHTCVLETLYTTYHHLWYPLCDPYDDGSVTSVIDGTQLGDGWVRPPHQFYEVRSLKLGIEVRNFSLWQDPSPEVIDQIRQEIDR